MSKSNGLESDFLNYILQATAPSWNSNTHLWIALFTADPGESMSLTNEATFTGYIRLQIDRNNSTSPFSASSAGSAVANTALLTFASCSGGSPQTITHAAIVTTSSGACDGYSFQLPTPIVISNGITPFIPIGNLTGSEN